MKIQWSEGGGSNLANSPESFMFTVFSLLFLSSPPFCLASEPGRSRSRCLGGMPEGWRPGRFSGPGVLARGTSPTMKRWGWRGLFAPSFRFCLLSFLFFKFKKSLEGDTPDPERVSLASAQPKLPQNHGGKTHFAEAFPLGDAEYHTILRHYHCDTPYRAMPLSPKAPNLYIDLGKSLRPWK